MSRLLWNASRFARLILVYLDWENIYEILTYYWEICRKCIFILRQEKHGKGKKEETEIGPEINRLKNYTNINKI